MRTHEVKTVRVVSDGFVHHVVVRDGYRIGRVHVEGDWFYARTIAGDDLGVFPTIGRAVAAVVTRVLP